MSSLPPVSVLPARLAVGWAEASRARLICGAVAAGYLQVARAVTRRW